MPQIPLLSGVYTSASTGTDFRIAYPKNLIPVIGDNGISTSYLKPADGVVLFATGTGVDRGGINWRGILYRVMGSKLCLIDAAGAITILGDVGGTTSRCKFDYSFDRLAIASEGSLYYWNGIVLTRVTDANLGTVNDMLWIDSYFMTTDGSSLVVTNLADPTTINPLKYGSAESDPDPIKGIIKIRNEVYAVGRYSTEVFQNVGGQYFPFQRIQGAIIQRGMVGRDCCCLFENKLVFLGGGKGESNSVWAASSGQSAKLATREIELILQSYSQSDLAKSVLEFKMSDGDSCLYIHLIDKTLVYDHNSSILAERPIWYILTSSNTSTDSIYKIRNIVRVYDKWIGGDPTSNNLGLFTRSIGSHYGNHIMWEFSTPILFNGGSNFILHELELIGLTGRFTGEPLLYTSSSSDGANWSREWIRTAGRGGKFNTRLNWLQLGLRTNWSIQKFRGLSDAHISIAALNARIEACT